MSFELLLDPATDARVRAEWNALLEAGLPSQARHTGASNAPHITLLAADAVDASLVAEGRDDWPEGDESGLDDVPGGLRMASVGLPLPLPLHLSGLVVFGRPPRGLVLARLVALSRPLQSLHSSVHRRASGVRNLSEQTAPDQWMPHITLANRLTPPELAAALDALADAPDALADAPILPAADRPIEADSSGSVLRNGDRSSGVRSATPGPAAAVLLRHWNGVTKTVTPLR